MTRNAFTAPVEACHPDEHRAGLNASARVPDWLAHLIALIVRYILERTLAARSRRLTLPPWWNYRPDLPAGSVEQLAASIRGAFGNAIAWTCLRRGIGPGHPDWPEISRAIVAFGGSLRSFRPGLPAYGLQWWENPNVIPGMIGDTVPTPAAAAMARLLSRLAVTEAPPPAPADAPAVAALARLPSFVPGHAGYPPAASPRQHGTGPPTGPPAQFLNPLRITNGATAWPAPPS